MLASSTMLLFVASRWTLGVGDPTVVGWLTVAAYIVAFSLCRRASRGRPIVAPGSSVRRLSRFWMLLALVLMCLGLNKQLDLQSLLTQVGRDLAVAQGWYGNRREIQALFVGAFVILGLLTLGSLVAWVWPFRRYALLPIVGVATLIAFVLVRAASFHHVDVFGGIRVLSDSVNLILELGGIAIIGGAACRYTSLSIDEGATVRIGALGVEPPEE